MCNTQTSDTNYIGRVNLNLFVNCNSFEKGCVPKGARRKESSRFCRTRGRTRYAEREGTQLLRCCVRSAAQLSSLHRQATTRHTSGQGTRGPCEGGGQESVFRVECVSTSSKRSANVICHHGAGQTGLLTVDFTEEERCPRFAIRNTAQKRNVTQVVVHCDVVRIHRHFSSHKTMVSVSSCTL